VASTITAEGYPTDHVRSIEWARDGTRALLATVAALTDTDLDAPTGLPDWSRRQACAHVARNAEGLGRLLTWARTGVATPMYASAEAREADIDRTSQAAAADLRADLIGASATFLAACDDLHADAWGATVRTMRGPIPVTVVPWYRVREVWIHAADLAAGFVFTDIPVDVSAALITELATGLGRREAADLHLIATDTDQQWTIGGGSVRVEASAGELAEWLTGRTTRPEAVLPPWI
jgi:maleylpyruvate isomerase